MEKLVLYNICNDSDSSYIKKVASNMKIKCIEATKKHLNYTIEDLVLENHLLLNVSEQGSLLSNGGSEESMLIFSEVSDKHMDKILFELRNKGIDITYKAVMTPTNRSWSISRMLGQMQFEKMQYLLAKGRQ